MINANELRIGNWVYQEDKDHSKRFFQIDSGHEIYKIDEFPEQCNPIPITTEILENIELSNNKTSFGNTMRNWEKVQWSFNYQKVYMDEKGVFHFVTHTDDFGDYQHGIVLKSLHQLQNLYFALTGEELKVNLNVETTN